MYLIKKLANNIVSQYLPIRFPPYRHLVRGAAVLNGFISQLDQKKFDSLLVLIVLVGLSFSLLASFDASNPVLHLQCILALGALGVVAGLDIDRFTVAQIEQLILVLQNVGAPTKFKNYGDLSRVRSGKTL